jgi:Flp pilus assembly protein TadG
MRNTLTRKYLKREDGGSTVETVLWFPIIMMIFGLMIDVAMIFHGQAKILRVVQEVNRQVSIGNITREAAEPEIEATLARMDITGTANMNNIAGVVYTRVDVDAGELQVLGYFSVLAGRGLNIQVVDEYVIENWEA